MVHSNFPTIHLLWCATIENRIDDYALEVDEAEQVFKSPTLLNGNWLDLSCKITLKKETAEYCLLHITLFLVIASLKVALMCC